MLFWKPKPPIPEDFAAKVREAFPKETFPAQAKDLEKYIRRKDLGSILCMIGYDLPFAELDAAPCADGGENRPYADAVENGDRLLLLRELLEDAERRWPTLVM